MSEPILYISKVLLDAAACANYRIQDDYSVHKFVYSLFPRSDVENRILYVDKGPTPRGRLLLVLSRIPPRPADDVESSSREISDYFWTAKQYRFEVILNPVRTIRDDGGKSKRVPIRGQLDQLNWFVEHAKKWGFEPDTSTLGVFIDWHREFNAKGRQYTFNRARFRGTLTISDPKLFRQSLADGLGHGKAFGFGLLQLFPVL